MRLLFVLGLVLAVTVPGVASPRYAVVVGVNRYDHLPALRAGVSDSLSLAAHYRQLGYDQVFVLNDQVDTPLFTPSLNHLLQTMEAVETLVRTERPQELVFAFAGHGVQRNGANYLCLADADLETERGLLNVDSQLVPWVRRLQAPLAMVFLDACRQSIATSRGVGWTRGIERSVEPENLTGILPQLAIFYASLPGEVSFETPDGTHGLFTQTLLEGLRQPTQHSLGGLRQYLEQTLPAKTMEAYGKVQIPSVGGEYNPDAVFTSYEGDVGVHTFGGHGEVLIQTIPPQAEVFADGIRLGIAPILLTGLQAKQLRVTAQTAELFAEEEIQVRSTGLLTIRLNLTEKQGRIFLQTDQGLVQASVDHGPFAQALDHLIDHLPVGKRHLRVLSDQGYFETTVEVANNHTQTLTPHWGAYGQLTLRLPPGSHLLLISATTGRQWVFSGPETTEFLPVGTYSAQNLDTNHRPWQGQIEVRTSRPTTVSPALVPTTEWLMEQKSEERVWRTTLDVSGWVMAGGGTVSAAVASWLWYQRADQMSRYQSAGLGSDFDQLRADIRGTTVALQWSVGAAAVQAVAALVCWWVGPHPEVSP